MALSRARPSLSSSSSFITLTAIPSFSCHLAAYRPNTANSDITTYYPSASLPITAHSNYTECASLHSGALDDSPYLSLTDARAVFRFKGLCRPTREKALKGTTLFFCFGSVGWTSEESPYETLGVEKHVNEEEIKVAYRQMAKRFHPDVYDGNEALHEGETAEERFIKIQAAYELLTDKDKRREYDADHRNNPLKASKSWMEWVVKKKKAYEQRGEMAVSHWAEQQQREMNLKARRSSRLKVDPEEERRFLAKEKRAAAENFETTLKRHTLVLKKRDILRSKAEKIVKKKLVEKLLQVEGLELDES